MSSVASFIKAIIVALVLFFLIFFFFPEYSERYFGFSYESEQYLTLVKESATSPNVIDVRGSVLEEYKKSIEHEFVSEELRHAVGTEEVVQLFGSYWQRFGFEKELTRSEYERALEAHLRNETLFSPRQVNTLRRLLWSL
ncbi:MAG: hypothetical protein ACOX0W_05495 [Sphaerochaetaceae bacterium]|jgi:hypothetical protein